MLIEADGDVDEPIVEDTMIDLDVVDAVEVTARLVVPVVDDDAALLIELTFDVSKLLEDEAIRVVLA